MGNPFFALAIALSSFAQQSPVSQPEPLPQKEEPTTFRTGVADVRVDAQVSEGLRLIAGLTQADFNVFDNRLPQPINYFGREREPITLLLLLDVSGSMDMYVQQIALASRTALRQLRAGDKVGIMVFARNTRVHSPFVEDLATISADLNTALRDTTLGDGTEINAALLSAARHFAETAPPKGRRAILIITDNLGVNYQAPDEEVIRKLHDANIVCNAIVVGRGRKALHETRLNNHGISYPDVFKISEATGGEAVKSDKADEAFAVILERLRSRYSLHYLAPGGEAGKYREINVELSPAARVRYPQAKLSFRKGYYAR